MKLCLSVMQCLGKGTQKTMKDFKKRLPVGIESFEEIRTEGYYFVDKTALIRDLLRNGAKVTLFTRPRRFGKSLNMSMLKSFFEIGCDKALFDGLEIAGDTELCEEYMGKFPVISISLKEVDAEDYPTARSLMIGIINREAGRRKYLLESDRLSEVEKKLFAVLLKSDMGDAALCWSLKELSDLLRKHYGKVYYCKGSRRAD